MNFIQLEEPRCIEQRCEECCINGWTDLADDDLESETKVAMMEKLLTLEVPASFRSGKPVLPLIKEDTTLTDLVGPNSWHLLQISGFSHEDVEGWLAGKVYTSSSILSRS